MRSSRLVVRHRGVAAKHAINELRACEPAFLIVVVERQQLIERLDRFLFAVFDFDAFDEPLLFQPGGDEPLLALVGVGEQFQGFLEWRGIGGLAPFLAGLAQAPGREGAIGVVLERRLERTGGFDPDVGVVVAEPLIEERLALRRRRADAIFDDAQVRDQDRRRQLGVRQQVGVFLFVVELLRSGLLFRRIGLGEGRVTHETEQGEDHDEVRKAVHGIASEETVG